MRGSYAFIFCIGVAALVASCKVGPDYVAPESTLSAQYKNDQTAKVPALGEPFKAFKDPELDRLIRVASSENFDLAAALARIDQSRAALGIAKADQYPALSGRSDADHNIDSSETLFSTPGGPYQNYRNALNFSYEVDLWGRIRRSVSQSRANLDATHSDYKGAVLSVKSEVARNYLSLRSLDREISLLNRAANLRKKRLSLTEARHQAGTANRVDVSRAATEYQSTLAEVGRLELRRGEFENALAALCGKSASEFSIAQKVVRPNLPTIPAGVPSDLLRRRPDVISAERRLAAASEGIGIAIAQFLPRLVLNGAGGTSTMSSQTIFNPSSFFYQLGADLTVPLFQGGRLKLNRARAEAEFEEALATYQQTLLVAVRDTENALVGSKSLDKALSAQRQATQQAEKTARLSRARYQGGLDSLFEVIETERETLDQERLLTQTQLNRQLASVNLIQAIGGEAKGGK